MCRRTIAVVVALLFVALPTFGGGQQGDDDSLEVVEVEFWNLFGGGDGETIASIVDEYNELNPGVEIVNMTQDWGQYYTKLRTAVLGGTSPDLGVSHITRLLELKSTGLIEPLGSLAEEVGIPLDFSVYPDGMVDAVTFDGDRYALPMDNLLFVLLANKAILREYGLVSGDGRAQIPDGAREFKNMLAEIGETGEYVPLVSSMGGWPPATLWFTFYQQMNGGRFLSDDNRSVAWDRNIALDAMTELNDLYAQFVPPELDDAWELFKSGEVALYVTGPWDINQGIAVLGDDLDVVNLPSLYDEPVFWTDAHSLVLPVNPDRTERQTQEAVRFIRWFGENNAKWAKAGHIPASVEARQSEEFAAMSHRDRITAEIDVVSYPATENVWLTFAPELYEPIEKMLLGSIDPSTALDEIEQRLNSALAK